MAGKKRIYRRWNQWNRRRWKRWNRYNYLPVKIDVSGDLVFPSGSSGQPKFSNSDGQIINFESFFGTGSEFAKYKDMFTYYRVAGIRLDFVPAPGNGSADMTHTKPVYVGWFLTGQSTDNIPNLPFSDKAMLLNPLQRTTRYWSFHGAQDDYKTMATTFSGYTAVYTAENATDNTGPAWSYRMTLYCLLKLVKT